MLRGLSGADHEGTSQRLHDVDALLCQLPVGEVVIVGSRWFVCGWWFTLCAGRCRVTGCCVTVGELPGIGSKEAHGRFLIALLDSDVCL